MIANRNKHILCHITYINVKMAEAISRGVIMILLLKRNKIICEGENDMQRMPVVIPPPQKKYTKNISIKMDFVTPCPSDSEYGRNL